MFTRTKVSGWAFGELLTSVQMNQLDIDHANAIDGAAGGIYTLSAPLEIDGDVVTIGDGLVVGADVNVAGELDVLGDVEFHSALAVSGAISSGGDTSVLGAIHVTGVADLNGPADVAGNAEVHGDTHLWGDCAVDGDLSCNSSTTLNTLQTLGAAVLASVTVQGNAILGTTATDQTIVQGILYPSGQGRILETGVDVTDADSSWSIITYRHLYMSSAIITGTHTYTLTGTIQNGDVFYIQNDSAFTQNIAGLVTVSLASGAGVKYVHINSTWRPFHW